MPEHSNLSIRTRNNANSEKPLYLVFCSPALFFCSFFPPAEPEAYSRGAEAGQNSHPIQRLRGGVRCPGL